MRAGTLVGTSIALGSRAGSFRRTFVGIGFEVVRDRIDTLRHNEQRDGQLPSGLGVHGHGLRCSGHAQHNLTVGGAHCGGPWGHRRPLSARNRASLPEHCPTDGPGLA
jgi:hypothetical protein